MLSCVCRCGAHRAASNPELGQGLHSKQRKHLHGSPGPVAGCNTSYKCSAQVWICVHMHLPCTSHGCFACIRAGHVHSMGCVQHTEQHEGLYSSTLSVSEGLAGCMVPG